MNQAEKIQYVNYVLLDKKAYYQGPSSLFKCRKFDEHTFEMLENNYMFLCVAEKLDDETECLTVLNTDNIYDQKTDGIKQHTIVKLLDFVRQYSSEENIKQAKEMIFDFLDDDGNLQSTRLNDLQLKINELAPNQETAQCLNSIFQRLISLNNSELDKKMMDLLQEARDARKIMRICSLCEEPDNKDVWERYGGDNSGYCVEYDMTGFKPANIVFPVIYSDERETNIVLSILGSFVGQSIFAMSKGQIKPDVSQFLRLFIAKNRKWECQNEWRIISDKQPKIDAPKINRIIVGKKATEENRLRMLEFCKKRNIPLEDQD